jgi:ribosomal protein L15
VVSLSKLNVFADGDVVTLQSLQKHGLVPLFVKGASGVKIVAGKLQKKLTVRVPVSASVKIAVEKAGGSVK